MKALKVAFDGRSSKINKIEKIKELKKPISVYDRLDEICANGLDALADEDAKFYLKCFGLFLKKDKKFMLRIRIPAGQLSAIQAQKIAELSTTYGEDYIDITTRQQLEFRYLEIKKLAIVLRELDSVGISTFQTGVDNFRNIVTSSFDGKGDKNLIKCKPIVDELQSLFFKKEDWIGTMPRKFNTGILGSTVNDCNIYGHDCCFVLAKKDNLLGFNLYLGGRVGMQAKDSGLFIKKEEVAIAFKATIELFKKYGFRDNRNKNRLHFLIEAVGLKTFVESIKKYSSCEFDSSGEVLVKDEHILNDSATFDLSNELKAYHLSIPSGVFKGSDLLKVALLSKDIDAVIRLSVEQSLYIIASAKNKELILDADIFKEYAQYQNTYFNHQIACAGIENCSFGVIPNKPDAIEMANYLQKEVPLKNAKVRMYWSACVKGCGINGVADIGFEGCKAKDENGNICYGVHISIGGKATKEAKEARILYKSVPLTHAKTLVKDLMLMYKREREDNESFESYDSRVLSLLPVEEILQRV
ncbi:MAG: ferredoxin-nitrite reductase [Sulfurimonas sp.]|jgi:ferredoxin-nitrite reductase